MKSIAKYLKPFVVLILLSLVMLFARAWADLKLPNQMSDIVNNGLQQGGVTEQAPKMISEKGMTLITSFMTAEDKEAFTGSYSKTADYYERTDFESGEAERAYGRAVSAIVNLAQDMAEQSGASENMEVEDGDMNTDIDLEAIYEMLPMLAQYPEGALAAYAPDSEDDITLATQKQVGVMFTRAFYKELGEDIAKIQRDYIIKVGLEMLLVTMAGVAGAVLNGYFSAKVGAGFARDLRSAVFTKVESFSSKEFDKFSTASLLTRTTNDVTQMQMLVTMGLRMICYAPIMGVGGVIMALQKSPSQSWIIAAAVAVLIVVIIILFRVVVPKFTVLQEQTDEINLVSRENLSGLMVIRAFGNEMYEENRFDNVNSRLTGTNRWINRVMSLMMPLMTVLMNVVSVLIIWVGSHAVAQSTLPIGDMMAFLQYAMQIIMSFLMIAMMFIMVPRAAVSGRRIAEVLNAEMIITDPGEPKKLKPSKTRTVEFDNVTFRYGRSKEPVLRNISFTAKPGETTAFIGATGSGKSSLVNLIPRLYDVTEGSIRIDGVDIRDLAQHELREEIGLVPQQAVLFSGTIADNIRFGREDADQSEIDAAIETAQASDFVQELPEKTEYYISQGGTNVSGGQRQRLAIARALAKRAPIYIFDDSFSALDFRTDAALRRALKKTTGDATVLIVAQRVSTIMQAEQIIVLDDGIIVGKGTHKELLNACDAYREIAHSQLSKEEL